MPPRGRAAAGQGGGVAVADGGAGPSGLGRGAGGGGGAAAGQAAVEVEVPLYVNFAMAQAMMEAGYMTDADAKAMLRRLLNIDHDTMYAPVVEWLNKELAYLDFSFERVKLPANDSWYLCVVNKEKDEAAKLMGSKFSHEQRELLKAVLECICLSTPAPGQLLAELAEINLLNLDVQNLRQTQTQGGEAGPSVPKKAKQLGLQEKTSTLQALVADGWLTSTKPYRYKIGPRSLVELREFILSALPEEVAATLKRTHL